MLKHIRHLILKMKRILRLNCKHDKARRQCKDTIDFLPEYILQLSRVDNKARSKQKGMTDLFRLNIFYGLDASMTRLAINTRTQ